MKAVFFRHGPAAPRGAAGVSEEERPLTPEGRRKTAQAAKGLRALDLGIDAIFTSPLARALQTAEILGETLRLKVKSADLLRPETAARRLLAGLRDLGAACPLLVGHEPLLSSSVALALGGAVHASIELKKAGLALVEFPTSSRIGTLQLLLAPSVLRRLGR